MLGGVSAESFQVCWVSVAANKRLETNKAQKTFIIIIHYKDNI